MEIQNLNLTNVDGKELIIREGKAPDIKEMIPIRISGNIDAPSRFFKDRKQLINLETSHVLIHRDAFKIILIVDECSPMNSQITGELKIDETFLKLGINTQKTYTPLELSQMFKMNRGIFEKHETAMNLVSLLQNFKAKVQKDIEKLDDKRGSFTEKEAQVMNSNIPPAFTLSMPIFKGDEKKTFEVEILINKDYTCSLCSPDANDIIKKSKDELIEKEISKLEGLLIIEI